MVDASRQVWQHEGVHLMHICAGPEDPHAEHSEERQTISHHSIVACLCSILGPDVHVLPEEKGRDNPDSD